jgi:peptidoglycan hydrolase-like protein with peptidoglycan-binding domain
MTTPRASRVGVALCAALLLVAACGSDKKASSSGGGTTAAQARVTNAEKAAADAETAFKDAGSKFCTEAKDYVQTIDRYGKVFNDPAATVGDVKTLGADLLAPRASTKTAGQAVVDARTSLEKANQEVVDARAALAALPASGASTAPTSTPAPPTTPSTVPPATLELVQKAETQLTAASQGITDSTPVTQAAVQYNSAAFAVEVTWLNLLNDAGCLTDDQQSKAAKAVTDYTVALQNALTAGGFYTAAVDGIYGPATVDAVSALQKAAGLPVTGLVDQATSVALDAAVASKQGAQAVKQSQQTVAVQTALTLTGFWTGPIDGKWTPELTDALKAFQSALAVPPTGAIDSATLAAIRIAIITPPSSTSTTSTSAPSSSSTTTTAAAATTTAPAN